MLLTIAAGATIALAIPQGTDTTFAVAANARLDLKNYAGEIVIETWTRSEVRIVADHSRRESVAVEQQDGIVRVRPSSWKGGDADFEIAIENGHVQWNTWSGARSPSMVEFTVTVPEGMPLDVGGPFTDVTITGPVGETAVQSNEGDVTVTAVRGPLTVRCVEGDVNITDVQGRMRIHAIDGDVWIENASGDIVAETTDGDIHLIGITSSNVEATSVDGDLQFAGPLAAQGLYTFATHDGDVTVMLPRDAGARVMVATYDGDVTSDFALDMPEDFAGRRARFTLGNGGAQLEIEAFDGDIEILYLEN
jgi:translation initiation factor IF-1